MAQVNTPNLQCPRCGYDLKGQSLAWHPAHTAANPQDGAACPVRGTCSECGLDFAWVDVFRGYRNNPVGLLEDPTTAFPIGCVRTLVSLARPATFWKRHPLEAAVMPSRLVSFALLLIGSGVLLLFIGLAAAMAANSYARGVLVPPAGGNGIWTLKSMSAGECISGGLQWALMQVVMPWELPGWVLTPLVATLAMPVALLLMPWTRAMCAVRPAHVLRAGVYGLASGIVLLVPVVVILLSICGWMVAQGPPTPARGWIGMSWATNAWETLLNANTLDLARWPLLLGMAWLVVLAIFWHRALVVGWRLPGAWLVCTLALMACTLGGILVGVLLDENFAYRLAGT